MSMLAGNHVAPVVNAEESGTNRELAQPQRGARERELLQVVEKPEAVSNLPHFCNGSYLFVYYRLLTSLAMQMKF